MHGGYLAHGRHYALRGLVSVAGFVTFVTDQCVILFFSVIPERDGTLLSWAGQRDQVVQGTRIESSCALQGKQTFALRLRDNLRFFSVELWPRLEQFIALINSSSMQESFFLWDSRRFFH